MDMHETILETLQELVYIADMETCELLYYNRALADRLRIPQGLRGRCHEILYGLREPCPFCTSGELSREGFCVRRFHDSHTGRDLMPSDSLREMDGRQVRIEVATDIRGLLPPQERTDAESPLQDRIDLCTRKFSCRDADIPSRIRDVLAAIGGWLHAERARILEVDGDVLRTTFAWCRAGSVPPKDALTGVPLSVFRAHQPVWIPDLEALRASSPEGYAILRRQGVRSLLAFPLRDGTALRGLVAVDNLDPGHVGPARELLASMTPCLSAALERRDALDELLFLGCHDRLTGLLNRDAFWRDVRERDGGVGFILLDIDGLKAINDDGGYAAGDAILRRVGSSLHDLLPGMPLYRMGGDEFLLLWQDGDEQAFRRDVERVRALFDGTSGFSASVGSAWVRTEDDPEEALMAADTRMFAAKKDFYTNRLQSGRSRCGLEDVLDLARPGRLDDLMASDSFALYCQPQYHVGDGSVVGAEILLRLRCGDEIIPPSQFIPVLEALYAMPQLDFHVFDKVCACLRRWRDEGRALVPMSVNFSRTTLTFPEVADKLEEIRLRHDVPAEFLHVEVTETATTEDFAAFQRTVESIRNRGFQISIDDFGVAYANLTSLARVSFDELKLDRSLLDDLCGNERMQRLLGLLINVAADMGIKTVAEGVETQGQLDILQKLGCHEAQGYLLSRPMPVEQFTELLR